MQPKAGQLGRPLSPQGRTKIGVALTHDGQHGLAEHRTQSPIAPPGLREIRPSAASARKACGSRYIWSSPDANQPLASATDRRPSATLISTSRASALATHRDHRHATPPRQASRKPRSVTSLSVRPVTFLSVIYNRLSRRVVSECRNGSIRAHKADLLVHSGNLARRKPSTNPSISSIRRKKA